MSELRKPIPPPSLETGLVRCYSRGRSVIAQAGAMHQHSKSLGLLSMEEVSKLKIVTWADSLVTKHDDMLTWGKDQPYISPPTRKCLKQLWVAFPDFYLLANLPIKRSDIIAYVYNMLHNQYYVVCFEVFAPAQNLHVGNAGLLTEDSWCEGDCRNPWCVSTLYAAFLVPPIRATFLLGSY